MAFVGTIRPMLQLHRLQQLSLPQPNSGIAPRVKNQDALRLILPKGVLSRSIVLQKRKRTQEDWRMGRRWMVRAVLVTEETAAQADVASLKTDLLAGVAGLDRGLSASESDVEAVDFAAQQLEAAGSAVKLPEDLDKLQGRWRLIYSSAFASGSLGGRRPGPPVGRLPLTLGQVYQRIDVVCRELDNIVDLRIGTPWPLPPLEVTATLAHTFELTGDTGIRITFEKTSAKLGGGLSQLPPYVLPQLPEFLRPPSSLRSGDFQITYLDQDLRISRGDRGELRIFLIS